MKKGNKILMIIVSILLTLVLITTSVLSGTLAKYTTSSSSSDKARVAKWGADIKITTSDKLPGNLTPTYKNNKTIIEFNGGDTGTLRMRPGSDYTDLVHIEISGKAEVRLKVTIMFGIGYTESNFKVDAGVGNIPSKKDFMPFGFTFGASDADGNVVIPSDYVATPWRDTTASYTEELIASNVSSKIVATHVKADNDYIEKIFEPNETIAFRVAGTNSYVNALDFGFYWPETYTNPDTNYNYDEIANWMLENLSTSTFAIRYTVTIEQVK